MIRDSLLSRFEGCLVGAAIGERLGQAYQAQTHSAWFGWNSLPTPAPECSYHSQQSVMEILIKGLPLESSFWQSHWQKHQPIDTGLVLQSLLPVVLYFHEYEAKKVIALKSACLEQGWWQSVEEAVLGVGYGLSLILRENLQTADIIKTTAAYLQKLSESTTELSLVNLLLSSEDLVLKKAGLQAIKQIYWRDSQANAIAIGFHCFAAFPQDFRLSVLRSIMASKSPQLAGMIAGALCGSYLGTMAIPTTWLIQEQPRRTKAAQLFAAWSGVYQAGEKIITGAKFGGIAGIGF